MNRSLLARIKLAAFNPFNVSKASISGVIWGWGETNRETTLLSALKALDLNLGPLHNGCIAVRFQSCQVLKC